MIQIADGFEYKGNKPLDSRLKYATIAEMVAVPVANLYDGCEAYVTATKKYYSYDSTNEVDETLGKWRERQSGGGGTSDYSALSNKPQIEGVTLSGNKTASDLGLAKLTDLADFITKTVDDLVNYYTKSQSYSKTEVDAIVTAIKNSRFEVVATLPTSDIKTNVIYLVPSSDPKTSNVKDEYINLDGTTSGWEKIGSTSVDLSNYVSVDDLNTALADYTTTTDLTTLLNGKQDVFQKYSMPTATEELVGTMYQYMGATNATYTHGYWYECIVGTEPSTYMWHQTSVQPASSLTVEDADGTALTQRDTMQFGTGFNATDDSENEKTVVEADLMQSGDMDDIVTPLPSIAPKKEGIKYSTTEQVIGEWINGKPLYQRTVTGTTPSNNTQVEYQTGWTNIENMFMVNGYVVNNYGNNISINLADTSTNTYVFCNVKPDGTRYYIGCEGNWLYNRPFVITFQYTKTTDTPNT